MEGKKISINQWLVIFGLTLLRLPRLLDLDDNLWATILPLVPFWFAIGINEFGYLLPQKQETSKATRLVLISLFYIAFIGCLFIVYTLMVYSLFQDSVWFILLGSGLLFGAIYLLYKFGKQIFAIGNLKKSIYFLGLAAFLIVVVSVIRTAKLNPVYFLNAIYLMTILVFGLSYRKRYSSRLEEARFLRCWVAGMNLYLIINLVLYLFGVQNPAENYLRSYDSVLLGMLGVDANRVYFPMAEGINAYGVFSGMVFVVNIVYVWSVRRRIKNNKAWALFLAIGAFAALISIIGADSRSALLFSGVIIALLLWQKVRWYPYFAGGMIAVQFAGLGARRILSLIKISERMLRKGTDVLSGRAFIWQQALNQLEKFNLQHLVGYGMYGQTVSGVVQEYQHLFVSYINKYQISLHSFILQAIYDVGYIGLLVIATFMVAMVVAISRKIFESDFSTVGLHSAIGFILYCLLMGSVSSVPTLYSPEIFFFFIFVWIMAL